MTPENNKALITASEKQKAIREEGREGGD